MGNNIETLLTKEEFDVYYKELLAQTEATLRKYHNTYLKLLDFRSQYRQDYKTHRIKHFLDKNNVLQYKKTCQRSIGYKSNVVTDNNDD